MCEPVYIDTSNIGKRVSTKKYKQSWHVFFGYYRFGRIKRMRTKGLKGMGFLMFKYDMLRFCQRNIETPNLTRWNRH